MKKPKTKKTGLPAQLFRHVCLVLRTVTKAKTMFAGLLKKSKRRDSHVLPMPESTPEHRHTSDHKLYTNELVYYDATWNSAFPALEDDGEGLPVSGYLTGLDEMDFPVAGDDEIDRLADVFIASFHEKFRLEKQESYRRYQEMLDRSM